MTQPTQPSQPKVSIETDPPVTDPVTGEQTSSFRVGNPWIPIQVIMKGYKQVSFNIGGLLIIIGGDATNTLQSDESVRYVAVAVILANMIMGFWPKKEPATFV